VEKHRLAHYDRNGGYIGAVSIPGRYVGLQFLHVFANGEMFAPHGVLAANSFVSDGHTAHRVNLPAVADQLSWQYDDGERAYGIGSARAPSQTIHVDNQRPAVTATTTYRTPTGTRFSVYLEDPDTGPLVVSLPDAQPPTRLSLRYHSATHATARPILVFEVASGSDGAIRLFLYGSTDEPQPVTFSGYLRISPAGAISPIEPVANPFSSTDPGSPAHLHVQPGTSSASLVLEGDHCASVYLHRDEVPD
jgi:hypothetical protein